MCLAGNFGACDGEAVVVILDVLRQDMALGITPEAACYYSIDDADHALQNINKNLQTCIHELEAKNANLTAENLKMQKNKESLKRDFKESMISTRQELDELQDKNNELDTALRDLLPKYMKLKAQIEKYKEAEKIAWQFGLDRQFVFSQQHEAIQSGVIDWNTAFAEHASHHS